MIFGGSFDNNGVVTITPVFPARSSNEINKLISLDLV